MAKIIITGHGNFATGIFSALSLISGVNKEIVALDFDGKDDGTNIRKEILKNLDDELTIICVDLLGGTPFRQAVMVNIEYPNTIIVTGINLGLVLELSLIIENNDITKNKILDEVVKIGREHVNAFGEVT